MIPQIRRGSAQRSQGYQFPAPIGGINAVTSVAQMPENECIYTYNLLAEDFGMEVRDGYIEWANGWTGGPALTVITFQGNIPDDDRLFIANDEGIWDVTTKGETSPTQVLVWPSSAGNAGICSYVNFTNDGNERFILLCDGTNGYYVWTQTTETWDQGSFSGGGVNVEDLTFVTIWKKRVWFIEKNSANAWYLPVASFSGNATAFNYGDQFRFGGNLVSLNNWTLDGGNGVDDYLVAISKAGDVVVYQGTDPAASADFGLVGSWYVGETPVGSRIATEFSGELYVLSVYGLTAMSQLLNGSSQESIDSEISKKVAPYIRSVLDETLDNFGWHIHIHPKQSLLYINSPPRIAREQLAFTHYFGNRSWSMIRGLNKSHTANWKGEVYWSDINLNKIYIQGGDVDKVFLDPDVDGPPEAIDWDLLTAFSSMGQAPHYKRCQYIRPMFVGGGQPAFSVSARYDYDISEIEGGYPVIGRNGEALWEQAIWGSDVWAGGIQASDNPRGANGLGRHIAVALRGRSSAPTTLAAFDITVDYGGLM